MKRSEAFPSKYLKAADLTGKPVIVTIKSVDYEKIENDRKVVVSFKGTEKQLILNLTNFISIEKALGSDNTDDWPGSKITLFPTLVDFKGDSVEAIRCRAAAPPKPAAPEPVRVPVPDDGDPGITDDDIPF